MSIACVFLFTYLGGASYAYRIHYGVTPAQFGVVFGLTGSAALMANFLAERVNTGRLALLDAVILFTGTAVSLAAPWLGLHLTVLTIGMSAGLLGLGCSEPPLMSSGPRRRGPVPHGCDRPRRHRGSQRSGLDGTDGRRWHGRPRFHPGDLEMYSASQLT